MKTNRINRRDFLTRSSIGLVGAGMGFLNTGKSFGQQVPVTKADVPVIKEYRTLGRTGFRVSDLGCGPAVMNDENVLKAVLATGLNVIDTAEFYGNGNNELLVGKAITGLDRSTLFVNTKIRITDNDTTEGIVIRVRKCLERLNTSYLDGLMLWNPGSVKAVKNKIFHQAFQQLKEEGRVKYCGVSCHGSEYTEELQENMEKIICGAIEDGRFDHVLFVYNYVQREMGENILKESLKKNVGTMLMKTDPLGKGYSDLISSVNKAISENATVSDFTRKRYEMVLDKQKKAEQFLAENQKYNTVSRREAAVNFVLDSPAVSSVIISFKTYEEIPEYIKMSGHRLTPENLSLIESLKENCSHLYCRHACGICEAHCPDNVPVNTIMRYNHYYIAQSRKKDAIQQYSALKGIKASKCNNCEGYCEAACPYGVAAQALLTAAHKNLVSGIS
jgi:uncharacterized protein